MIFKQYDPKLFRTKRIVLKMTINEVAEACGITRQTVSNIEHGRTYSGSSVTLIGVCLDIIAKEKGIKYTKLFDSLENSFENKD